jgi:hypothetical protein
VSKARIWQTRATRPKGARRPSPSPTELGLAARFLAPRSPKSILTPVQRDVAPKVDDAFRSPAATDGDGARQNRGTDR